MLPDVEDGQSLDDEAGESMSYSLLLAALITRHQAMVKQYPNMRYKWSQGIRFVLRKNGECIEVDSPYVGRRILAEDKTARLFSLEIRESAVVPQKR